MHFLTIAHHAAGFGVLALFGLVAVGMACAMPRGPEMGSALSACGKCEEAPIPRDWRVIDRIDPARGAAPGRETTVQWNGIAPKNRDGYHAMVRSIKISGNALFTTDGTNPAVTAYQVRSLFQLIHLSDAGGHSYFAGCNGRTVLDDFYLRHWRALKLDGGNIPQAIAAGEYRQKIDLEFALQSRARGGSPTERLISLAALQQTDGSQGFRFTMADALAGAPDGLVLTGFERDDGKAGLQVEVDLVWLENAVIDAPWAVREYTITQANGTLKRPGDKTEYAAVRYFPEDDAQNPGLGQQLAAGIDAITLEVGGNNFGEQRAVDMINRQRALILTAPDSAEALGLSDFAQPAETGVTVPMLLLVPHWTRESAPAGPVSFAYATQPANTARYIHATVSCETSDRQERILAALKCGTSTCYQPGNVNPGVTDTTAPKIVVPLSRVG